MALLYFPHHRVEISFLVRRQPQTQILSGSYIGNWIGRHSCLTLINSPIPSAQASTPQLWSFLNQPSQQPDKRRQDSIIHLFHSLRKFLQPGQFLSTLVIVAPHFTPLSTLGGSVIVSRLAKYPKLLSTSVGKVSTLHFGWESRLWCHSPIALSLIWVSQIDKFHVHNLLCVYSGFLWYTKGTIPIHLRQQPAKSSFLLHVSWFNYLEGIKTILRNPSLKGEGGSPQIHKLVLY